MHNDPLPYRLHGTLLLDYWGGGWLVVDLDNYYNYIILCTCAELD